MSPKLPATTRALVVQESKVPRKPLYHDAALVELPLAQPQPGEVVVKIAAVGFNHKDVWIRMGQYPAIAIGAVFGGDGAGTVIASGTPNDPLLGTRVFLTPSRGWEKDPQGPESTFGILGGTFSEYIVVERDQVVPTPEHLDDVHVAAWPIGGVTAWRAVAVNAQVQEGQNVLITAKGANVYVTSGSADKLARAYPRRERRATTKTVSMIDVCDKSTTTIHHDTSIYQRMAGSVGSLLNKKGAMLDAIIDSAGGDIMGQAGKILKQGGRVVCYGMTASPKITLTMRQVLANQQLLGSTMGSHQDLQDATAFIDKHRIVPIVSHVLDGLESADAGFDLIKRGDQFGKVVIKLRASSSPVQAAKL
ncbi:chaperonin 10-like protein [Pholiota molesta]|nr:chaperonin 10-like protein [Pholiota molesta]